MDVVEGGGVDLTLEGGAVWEQAAIILCPGLATHGGRGALGQPGCWQTVPIVRGRKGGRGKASEDWEHQDFGHGHRRLHLAKTSTSEP